MDSITLNESNILEIALICDVTQQWVDFLADKKTSHGYFYLGLKGKGIPVGPIGSKSEKIMYLGETLIKDDEGNFTIES